ncbi:MULTISPECIES: ribulose-phosphate 3-epimerase [unclassified Mycoplasma]|uniref:ribulose-phosphate 3-epimerase n=1 Tax=unclassified Mycoplasma TaxID=2683645 RepID=UPI00211B94F1|nr:MULTISPECIES: ribulose-phosphate 3-epimerase [unclassified Mycoplasma]UUM19700.1 ribulose-phosphate 3-epimerase [Mycoplasma sp. 1578d]UUM24683.1 ribulose-phosphate 3-epimerase [Mycoplasma sp. 3686d]
MKKYVTPSLLNADPKQRPKMAEHLIEQGIKWIHYDIMDGEFVQNTAIEVGEIINIDKNVTKHFKDAHLMVQDPYLYANLLSEHVELITFHYEAIVDDTEEFLNYLIDNKDQLKIGLAIKPHTPVESIKEFLPHLSLVLVMSVEPGKGGQKFMPIALDKIKELKNLRAVHSYQYLIQVDGGINDQTGPLCFKAGADACVAGTYLVSEPTKDRINTILGNKYKNKAN